jgi:hypothetical protein
MRTIIRYIREYWKLHFDWKLYLAFFLFTGAIIGVNYGIDLEDGIIDRKYGLSEWRMVMLFGLHIIGYYGVVLIGAWITGRREALRQPAFWWKSLIGFAILAFYRGFYYHYEWRHVLDRDIAIFVLRCVKYGLGWITIALPLFMLYRLYDHRREPGFYGIRFQQIDWRPYFAMLLIVGPLAFIASFTPGFLEVYPKYPPEQGKAFAEMLGLGEWSAILTFEFAYLSSFFLVELFFRGFLILGLDKYLKQDVILPMAATYAVLHFGKPLGETVSSVFGGYLLGIFAWKGRNIWGGVFIHMGVAFFMDLFAFLQKYVW